MAGDEETRHVSAWRADDDVLQPCGSIPANSRWLPDSAAHLCSLPLFLQEAKENEVPPPAAAAASSSSLFQTATGKSVQVSGAAMKRALALFGGDHDSGAQDEEESSNKKRWRDGSMSSSSSHSLFQTGTGKPLEMKPAALDKARSILEQGSQSRRGPRMLSSTNRASVAPFKQPRRLRFVPPLLPGIKHETRMSSRNRGIGITESPQPLNIAALQLNLVPSTKFMMPSRPSLEEYFHQQLPRQQSFQVEAEARSINSDSAKHYKLRCGEQQFTALDLRRMLLEAGAKPELATTEWVENHYRWIIWKLASLERCYSQGAPRFLTLESAYLELKYRFAREVIFGHRSAIRRICERDSSSSVTMVLCVAAIRRCPSRFKLSEGGAKLELTDGWYSLSAILDAPLSGLLDAGKIFPGQKLLIAGATLLGAEQGLPPLEAADVVTLVLHANGTYRTQWASRLGFCKRRPLPLALNCIKQDGGLVPATCILVSRIYPLLYMERYPDGRSVTRSARAEQLAEESFLSRRAALAETTSSKVDKHSDEDMSEGARLFRLLESSDEPEIMMADMSSEQHASVRSYQAQHKAAVEERIHQALEAAGLLSRDVTAFLKVRAGGLQTMAHARQPRSIEALITVWAPSDEQVSDLSEGGIYTVSLLKPQSPRSSQLLHLSTTKSSRWKRRTETICDSFVFSYKPREAILLSSLEAVSSYSEFDTAGLILHVGVVKEHAGQWVFATDGSCRSGRPELLAIEFSALSSKFDGRLRGSVVGFCNLVKRQPDEFNCLWIAGASDLTAYSTNMSTKSFGHLSKSAALATRWSKSSQQALKQLHDEVQRLVGTG